MQKMLPIFAPLLVVLMTACIPDTVQIPESELLQYLERRSGLIAYVGADSNIYTIDQSGNNKTAITYDANFPGSSDDLKFYQYLSWSRESDKLGFVSIHVENGIFDASGIYSAEIQDSKVTEIFTSSEVRPVYLYWSPDGEFLSFLSRGGDQAGLSLNAVSRHGGESVLLEEGNPVYYVWSPNSEELLAHLGVGIEGELKFLQMGGESPAANLSQDLAFFLAPEWSPNFENIYLAITGSDGISSLVEANQAGNPIRTLASFAGPIIFSLNQDGKRMAFLTASYPPENFILGRLRVLGLDNPDEVLETQEDQVLAFFWSPNGDKVAYFSVASLDSDGGASVGNNQGLIDLRILDLDSEISRHIISFRPTDELFSIFSNFGQHQRSSTIWSPDGRYVVISALNDEDQRGIYVISTVGGRPPRFIDVGRIAFWSWK